MSTSSPVVCVLAMLGDAAIRLYFCSCPFYVQFISFVAPSVHQAANRRVTRLGETCYEQVVRLILQVAFIFLVLQPCLSD